jgi:hypothetical protein
MPTYTNLSILQGWLEIESVSTAIVNRQQVPILNGWIYTTDHTGIEDCFDERHPVILTGRPAEAILEITRKLKDKLAQVKGISLVDLPAETQESAQVLVNQGRPYVIAQGKLLSHGGSSCLDIRHISVLGLPWGALDILADFESVTPGEARDLAADLSVLERAQIGQAVAIAMRSLIIHRQDNEASRG